MQSEALTHRRLRLSICVGLLLVIWLVVLPRISKLPAVERWSAFLDDRGVNPNAKFFTDQPVGFVKSRQVMQRAQENAKAFWEPVWQKND
jgi:hypothetical protein